MNNTPLFITCVFAAVLAFASARLEFPQSFSGEADLGALEEALASGAGDLLHTGDLHSYLANDGLWPQEQEDRLFFPTLTEQQRKFAVNPGYPEYRAEVFGDLDAVSEDDSNDEVPQTPFLSDDQVIIPKKASLKALLNQDPLVLANAIEDDRINDIYFTTIVGVTSGLAVFLIVGAGFLFHRARKNAKAAEDVEYPAYGVTGPGKETSPTSGDRKLAQNAQLYHYQHQKQQMIAFDCASNDRRNGANSDNESEDGEEGDYTVYECPGLAPTGEMEVRNPMFEDDATPKVTK